MSGPQLEDGYTRIANEILEVISQAKFNGTQFKIILAILRYTYGFNRKFSEFSLSFLSDATGTNKSQIKREIDKLIGYKVIRVVKESDYNHSRVLSFNKNYEEWDSTVLYDFKKSTVCGLEYPKDHTPVSELEYSTVCGLEYQERNIKDNTTITTTNDLEENPNNFTDDMGADLIHQEKESVAGVDADSTKQFSPVSRIEHSYLADVRKRNISSGTDLMEIVKAYEKYKDHEFIIAVMRDATKDNINRNGGRCTIKSFNYFSDIFEDRWKEKCLREEAENSGTVQRDFKKDNGYDLSGFLYNGD